MANYGPSSLIIAVDDGPGGSSQAITQFVQDIGDVTVEQLLEEVHTFGDSWEEHLPVGIGKAGTVEIGGIYDGAASTPDAYFAGDIPETPAIASRTLTITWGSTKTTTVEFYLQSYTRTPDKNALTRWKAVLQTTGSVSEA